jgi:hypothetical protein
VQAALPRKDLPGTGTTEGRIDLIMNPEHLAELAVKID